MVEIIIICKVQRGPRASGPRGGGMPLPARAATWRDAWFGRAGRPAARWPSRGRQAKEAERLKASVYVALLRSEGVYTFPKLASENGGEASENALGMV